MELANITNVCSNSDLRDSPVLEWLYCSTYAPYMPTVLLSLITSLLFYVLAITADGYLCPALEELSKFLGLSESLAGVTLVAFGNGAPDVFSALSGIRQNKSSMVFSQLFGSGAFVSALVAGIVMIVAPPFTVDWPTFSRDMIFYLSGSIFTFYVFYRSKIHLMHAVAFVGIYVLYIAAVGVFTSYWQPNETIEIDEEAMSDTGSVYSSMKSVYESTLTYINYSKAQNWTASMEIGANSYGTFGASSSSESDRFTSESSSSFILAELILHTIPWTWEKFKRMSWFSKIKNIISLPIRVILSLTVPVVDRDAYKRNWCKTLNTMQCVLTPAFAVFLFAGEYDVYGIPLSFCVLPSSLALGLAVHLTSEFDRAPKYHIAFAIIGFAASVAWIYRTCEILVSFLSAIGTVIGIPESVMGLTLLSWGSCIGDLVVNVTIARHGFAAMAISAAFGGILLDMLLGLGIPYLFLLPTTDDWTIDLDWSYAVIPLFTGVVSFVIVATASLWYNEWRTSKTQGWIFISIYVATISASVAVSVVESVGGFT